MYERYMPERFVDSSELASIIELLEIKLMLDNNEILFKHSMWPCL